MDRPDTLRVVPEEVVDHIVSFLDAPALMACELVCRQWCRIARVSPAWRRIVQAMSLDGVPQPSFPADAYPLGWKQLYMDGNNLARLRLLQEEVDVARLQLDEDVPPNPQVQVGGVTLQLAQVWREAEDREDSKLTFFLELPQATPSSSAVFYPNVGFIMGFEPTNHDAPIERFPLTIQFKADSLTWGWEELIPMRELRRLGWLWFVQPTRTAQGG
ncbi:HEAT repeat domain containing protein [Acanthamoeba castellanii str. Neff]|uniref:HEAT repeat domain containing protein n=1 Tax=Acanthamoeba castellanii (strain ATCC 30010 / Neff) TaxID=1257118 RepID=L8H7X4_ACACF|nr:HEAT repeat domain containing protein [Acanthamoeba castellanii str. Neff]ELR21250.1 HEAT repeat domain containing protein [Acanthamoeba castellanii str. Neff]